MNSEQPRQFICPETGEACLHGNCLQESESRQAFCREKQLANSKKAEAKEVARQVRIETGKFTVDDLGL